MNIIFWINKKRHKNIYCRLSKDGYGKKEMATGIHIDPELWENGYTLAKGTSREAQLVNQKLQDIKFRLDTIIYDLSKEGTQTITPLLVRNLYQGKDLPTKDRAIPLIKTMEEVLEKIKPVVEATTYTAYDLAIKRFKDFLGDLMLVDINVHAVDRLLVEQFVSSSRDRGNKYNTVKNKINRLSALFDQIMINYHGKKPAANPFKVKIKKLSSDVDAKQNKSDWIDIDTQDKISNTKMPGELEYARNMLLFQIYTGLAWVDMSNFDPDDHVIIDVNNIKWIRLRRQKTKKTGKYSEIPLSKEASKLIEYFSKDQSGTFMRQINYKAYRSKLTAICKRLDISTITSHQARHTFGVRMLEANISMEAVSHMMGHSSIKITESVYAKVSKRKISMETEKARRLGLL